jgi:hypothetical protein
MQAAEVTQWITGAAAPAPAAAPEGTKPHRFRNQAGQERTWYGADRPFAGYTQAAIDAEGKIAFFTISDRKDIYEWQQTGAAAAPAPAAPEAVTLTFRSPAGEERSWTGYAAATGDYTVATSDRTGRTGYVTAAQAAEIAAFITAPAAAPAPAPAPAAPTVVEASTPEAQQAEKEGVELSKTLGPGYEVVAIAPPQVAGVLALKAKYGGEWSYIPGIGYIRQEEQVQVE